MISPQWEIAQENSTVGNKTNQLFTSEKNQVF